MIKSATGRCGTPRLLHAIATTSNTQQKNGNEEKPQRGMLPQRLLLQLGLRTAPPRPAPAPFSSVRTLTLLLSFPLPLRIRWVLSVLRGPKTVSIGTNDPNRWCDQTP